MADARIEELRALLPRAMLPDWVRLGSRLVRLLRDNHHAVKHDAVLDRLLAQARQSVALREERSAHAPQVSYPAELPISARREEIVAAIRKNQVLVVAGETGSGKTTQIPKMCLEASLGIEAKIGCTQPRRVAALSISRRVAEELNVAWGGEVGCKIRFDDRSSPETYIKFMTDGILLAETQGDPLLSEYNALMIDEAHERSLNIDFLLGHLKGLLVKRPELKLIITSATIDTEAFSRAFDGAPVIEVSGRVYPVEVVYQALDAASEDAGELTYIDGAVRAAEQVLCEPGRGDVLIFMPGERDIRETSDALKTRFANDAEIIPLFGRLSSADQQRVFAPAVRRKIVVATNIAETSLTIPGIRYVIDSGLARISRYSPRTRTRRLPIEPISQSSANQRKGRSGRLENGVCIRLYSEPDFLARPAYTQPEIQRANLAEVILRMKAFRLGDIETFPFINPPPAGAIEAGYRLLQELGALNDNRELTPLGGDLARLPIDPTLGRMLLQAHHEHATRELLIIASGLSIQDPRERPLDQKDAAAAAHGRFADPRSDFLTLLNIWNAVHDRWEELGTQNQRRKFCRANFLSYLRMREWQDLHAQLFEVLQELGTGYLNESNADYDAIHRSILAGLLGHVAQRTERNRYKGVGNRELFVFPGSALYVRNEKQAKPKKARGRGTESREKPPPAQSEWIIAGELVETSRLFARTLAGFDPLWIIHVAPHLCRAAHQNPHWSATDGRVMAAETVTFFGLQLRRRKVAYGPINGNEATEIFIRSALVEEALFSEPQDGGNEGDERKMSPSQLLAAARPEVRKVPARYAFVEHNRQLRQKIEIWQTRSRHHDLGDLDQALFDFYAGRLQNVSSLNELDRRLREHSEPGFLCATEADLAGGHDLDFDAAAFPDAVPLAGHSVPLSYSYSPGEERDGVTLKLEFSLAQSLSPASVEWSVPGLRQGQVEELLRALPKSLRRQLMPLAPKVDEITRELRPSGASLKQDLARFLRERYGLEVSSSAWRSDAVPQHLRPRIEILDHKADTLTAGRDLDQLRQQLEKAKMQPAAQPQAWAHAAEKWERFGVADWTFGDLPERVTVSESAAGPVYAWPGLQAEDGQVNVRLFPAPQAARAASLPGVGRLIEIALQRDLGWLQKDLRSLSRVEPLLEGFATQEELQATAFEHLKRHLLPSEPLPALAHGHFAHALATARQRLRGLAPPFLERVEDILKLRQEILRRYGPIHEPARAPRKSLSDLGQLTVPAIPAARRPPFVAGELEALLPRRFLLEIPFDRLPQVPRYLKALLIRAERASLNPLKDRERAGRVTPYLEALQQLKATPPEPGTEKLIGELRWMVEEYKVSLFAQELGTASPISPKRLDQQFERIRSNRT
ncbi:MAG TPA: ATP-dependent RNA helicase HrpA [Verrucomicrobiae bacterium]